MTINSIDKYRQGIRYYYPRQVFLSIQIPTPKMVQYRKLL